MAKVIGFDKEIIKRCTCKKCSAIVEYVPSEKQERKHTTYDGSTDYWKVIMCPNCFEDIKV